MPWIHEYRALRIFTWNEVIHSLFGTCLVPFASTLPASSFHFNIFRVTQCSPRLIDSCWISMNRPPTKIFNIHRKKTLRPFLLRKSISGALRLVADVNFGRGDPSISPTMRGQIWVDDFLFPVWWWDMFFFLKRYVPSSHFHTSDYQLALVFRMVGRAFLKHPIEEWSCKIRNSHLESKQMLKSIYFESVQWHWTSQACCIFLNDFAARNVHEDYNLLFSLIDRDQNGRSWKKWTNEGCSNFTGSPPKYTWFQISLIMGSQNWFWLFLETPEPCNREIWNKEHRKVPMIFYCTARRRK